MNRDRKSSIFKGITRNIFLLGLVSLFTDLSSQMIFPLIPLYLVSVLGTGALVVGICEGAAETTASLIKVFSGYWSDRLKRRKPFVFIGYSLSAVTKPLFALARTWPLVLTIRMIERVGKGIRSAPRDAIVAESVDRSVRGKAYGFHRAMDGLGSVLGALLAFILLSTTNSDYARIFLLAGIPGIAAVLFILFIKEPERTEGQQVRTTSMRVSFRALPANLRLLIVAASVFYLGHFGYAFLLLRAKDIGLTDQTAILLYVLFYVVYVIAAIPAGMLSDRVGRKPVLMASYLIFAIVSLGLIFTTSLRSVLPFFAIYGMSFAMFDSVQRAYVVDFAPEHLRATALGTFHAAVGLVALPGGYVAGMLWDKMGPEATFVYGLALAVISSLLLLSVKPTREAIT
ncbi:MAG: MFS transporter [Dehalococcoidia bacterium]|nr:MAG: MFS transporter [Dehalococcoidia bacterium]